MSLQPMGSRALRAYNKTLQRTYPDCRLRWSERFDFWLLERKARYARTDIDPSKYPRDAVDTFIQRRDGYYTAGRYMPRGLPPVELLVRILLANDPDRMSVPGATPEERANNFVNAMEEREAAELAEANKDGSFQHTGLGAELYDQLAWAEGRRVAVPAKATGLG